MAWACIAFVVSMNLHRRHLDESQRALVGAKIKKHYEPAAKGRRRATQNNASAKAVPANLREQDKGEASEKAAEAVNVSARSVDAASKVLNKGDPALIKAVEEGQVKVSIAAAVADCPKAEQKAVVAEGPPLPMLPTFWV